MYVRQWDVSAPTIIPLPRPPPKKIHPYYYAGRVSNAWYTAQNEERKLTIVHVFTVINLTNSFKTSPLKSLKTLDSLLSVNCARWNFIPPDVKDMLCIRLSRDETDNFGFTWVSAFTYRVLETVWPDLFELIFEPWSGLITQHKLGINCQKAGKL